MPLVDILSLSKHRDTGQRTGFAGGNQFIGFLSLMQGMFFGDGDNGAYFRVDCFDAVEISLWLTPPTIFSLLSAIRERHGWLNRLCYRSISGLLIPEPGRSLNKSPSRSGAFARTCSAVRDSRETSSRMTF